MVYLVCFDNIWFAYGSKNRKKVLYFRKMTILDIVLSKTNVVRRLRWVQRASRYLDCVITPFPRKVKSFLV